MSDAPNLSLLREPSVIYRRADGKPIGRFMQSARGLWAVVFAGASEADIEEAMDVAGPVFEANAARRRTMDRRLRIGEDGRVEASSLGISQRK